MEEIVKQLIRKKETITTMESCTGGMIANEITNVSGSSSILKYALVTYSSEAKVKFGVNQNTIDTYTVYSKEVAEEMAKVVTFFTGSDWGIGITGYLGDRDPEGLEIKENLVYFAIYNRKKEEMNSYELKISENKKRVEKKKIVMENCKKELLKLLSE